MILHIEGSWKTPEGEEAINFSCTKKDLPGVGTVETSTPSKTSTEKTGNSEDERQQKMNGQSRESRTFVQLSSECSAVSVHFLSWCIRESSRRTKREANLHYSAFRNRNRKFSSVDCKPRDFKRRFLCERCKVSLFLHSFSGSSTHRRQ